MRFLGNIEAKTDAKGRAFLPAIFRKVLQAAGEENLVLRKDVFQKCLVLYPESVWNGRLDMLKNQLRPWKPTHQQMFRQFVSEAEVVNLDGNGRFLISKRLQKAADIEQDIQFIGMDDTIEIWTPQNLKLTLKSEEDFGNEFEQIMNSEMSLYHVPVLLQESVDGLDIKPDGIYVDVTFGGGGHSREILSRIGENGHLYSFDQDEDAEKNILNDNRFTFVRSNFRYLRNWMRYYGVEHIDGLLADLGVSSHHFDDETRGFSFRFDAPLDMRMNKRSGMTAAEILNNYDEEQLADIFYIYGEIKNARKVASAIIKARGTKAIETTGDLIQITESLFPREREKKETAKLFQALRIEVNHEMEALKEMLYGAQDVLREGGRLSVITYHSLEDRIVKNIMRAGNAEGKVNQDFFGRTVAPFRQISNKVIVPSEEEQQRNPRSRSAKLRIAERCEM